jgi:predicted metal-binding protein
MTAKKIAARPFVTKVPEERLMKDLEDFRHKAMEMGAAAAEIIQASQIIVDERVRLKCTVPRCLRAGETPNCPPYAPELDVVRRAFEKFSWAILLKTHLEPIEDYAPGNRQDGVDQSLLYHKKTSELVYEIELLAYKQGYHLAMGLGGGSCKDYLCHGLICQFLDSGRCRFPFRARPAMEAMGIDVVDLTNKVGWKCYPLLDDLSQIPCAISVGLVLVY